jgi:hypothetical protein
MNNIIRNWNNRTIRIRDDRYVSLTDMAQATGKLFADWNRLSSTKSYLATLSSVMMIPTTSLVQVIQGGNPQNQGTWAHPKVAIRFAQWCSDEFAVWVDCQIDELMTTGSVSIAAKAPIQSLAPFWYQRLLLDQKTNTVPNGYFSIFREVIPLVGDLEAAGYVLPDNAVPDISVGLRWVTYLKTINVVVQDVARYYPHTYPDKRGVRDVYCYPESMLPTFRQWFREQYKTDHLYRYLKTKDKASLPAVDKVIHTLMAAG